MDTDCTTANRLRPSAEYAMDVRPRSLSLMAPLVVTGAKDAPPFVDR
jgi:hypothetical protein